jgi:hypothetical protein
MSLDAINKDDYGYTLELTVIDTDTDSAADVSGYTTSQSVVLKDPTDTEATKSASFKTDGSDGIVQYTVADGDIDAAGVWHIRVKLVSGSATLRSEWKTFEVGY